MGLDLWQPEHDLWQLKHEECVAPAPLPYLPRDVPVVYAPAGSDGDILNAVHAVAHRKPPGARVEDLLPENLTRVGVERPETPGVVGDENQPAPPWSAPIPRFRPFADAPNASGRSPRPRP